MTTTAASTPDVQARAFLLLLRLRPADVLAPGAVASASAAAGIVAPAVAAAGIAPIGCFGDGSSCSGDGSPCSGDDSPCSGGGSSRGVLCRGELASPYCSGPRAFSSDGPA